MDFFTIDTPYLRLIANGQQPTAKLQCVKGEDMCLFGAPSLGNYEAELFGLYWLKGNLTQAQVVIVVGVEGLPLFANKRLNLEALSHNLWNLYALCCSLKFTHTLAADFEF